MSPQYPETGYQASQGTKCQPRICKPFSDSNYLGLTMRAFIFLENCHFEESFDFNQPENSTTLPTSETRASDPWWPRSRNVTAKVVGLDQGQRLDPSQGRLTSQDALKWHQDPHKSRWNRQQIAQKMASISLHLVAKILTTRWNEIDAIWGKYL